MANAELWLDPERLFPPEYVGCGAASEEAYDACIERGGGEAECRREARAAFRACLRIGQAARRLRAHALQETLEKMLAEAEASARLWEKVFADENTAMIFAGKIEEAFKEAGIELPEGQTYGCILTAGARPDYLSQLVPDAPEAGSRLFQLYEPTLMKAVMRTVEKDRVPKV